jgi:hypothetical protein
MFGVDADLAIVHHLQGGLHNIAMCILKENITNIMAWSQLEVIVKKRRVHGKNYFVYIKKILVFCMDKCIVVKGDNTVSFLEFFIQYVFIVVSQRMFTQLEDIFGNILKVR